MSSIDIFNSLINYIILKLFQMENLKEACKQKIKNIFNSLKMQTNSPSFLLVTD